MKKEIFRIKNKHKECGDIIFFEDELEYYVLKFKADTGYYTELTTIKYLDLKRAKACVGLFGMFHHLELYKYGGDTEYLHTREPMKKLIEISNYIFHYLEHKDEHIKKLKLIEENERNRLKENFINYCKKDGSIFVGKAKLVESDLSRDRNVALFNNNENSSIKIIFSYFELMDGYSRKAYREDTLEELVEESSVIIKKDDIDCVYLHNMDYFDRRSYELDSIEASTTANINEFNRLTNNDNSKKIDVGGMVVGGLIGGTAGAILGGMPSKNSSTSYAPENNVSMGKYLEKGHPCITVKYRRNGLYKNLNLLYRSDSLNDDKILLLFDGKIVDEYTGKNFYEIKNKTIE
ncbi:hypothetical protein [Traorella massiliensis]|uniref:hypothetical protein n=1 Tax=Traorella massiliensis TaxID=1903263 RepID=UPI002352235F|nr:hypothetical protein [Traorella massiliensis]